MTVSNRARVDKALQLLKEGLQPYVLRELQGAFGKDWARRAEATLIGRTPWRADDPSLDTQATLSLMIGHWEEVFRRNLGPFERTLVHELSGTRNRHAHEEPFTTDDTYRALDSAGRLLTAVGASAQAEEVEREKQELLRIRYEEQSRRERQKAQAPLPETGAAAGLPSWRSIITPHPDVSSGRYLQAEFAADLAPVHRGEGADEYREPVEFYRRTFLTAGLRDLLKTGLKRLAGDGAGDPVVELQTNFGGGKTHSMLALYHLFSGTPASQLAGVDAVIAEAGTGQPPAARRAVIVGTALSPSQPRRKPDGTTVNTLWGELAWQLGGREGYALVQADDEAGTAPGSDTLRQVLAQAAPCLILIDEWVAYARQLYRHDGLPGGSFDANTLNFAQSLSEAAKQVPRCFVVVSVPASTIEVGGEGGETALQHLKNTISRIAMPWTPASAEESFEIVRRRLFQEITDPKKFAERDAVVKQFADFYRTHGGEFPDECRDTAYQSRIRAAYPVHPELFDRLYNDWSTLDRFQRTRGVLRLMAAVIHTLWERGDGGALIMPSSLPLDEPAVLDEVMHYLDVNWRPIIEHDVDGPSSLPLAVERANPSYARFSAARRVARTVFLGSAPRVGTSLRGLDIRNIKLGCAQPGETVATFGDALRRLTDEAAHLYVDSSRYWYDTQRSVTRDAQDRAAGYERSDIFDEIRSRLRDEVKPANRRGDFRRVHPCPASHAEVADEMEAGLVFLDPSLAHVSGTGPSDARDAVLEYLQWHGSGPRNYANALVFLAADRTRLQNLEQAVRLWKAWQAIVDEADTLDLTAFHKNQAITKAKQADETIAHQLPETYCWALAPTQEPRGPIEVTAVRVSSTDPLAVRAAKKLVAEEALFIAMGGSRLRLEVDRIPLWRGDHVPVRQLLDDFARYPYLPRLRDHDVLLAAVRDGVNQMFWRDEGFAIADRYDEARGRYVGLKAGPGPGMLQPDGSTLLVRSEVATVQIEADRKMAEELRETGTAGTGATAPYDPSGGTSSTGTKSGPEEPDVRPPRPKVPRRFHGSVRLDPLKVSMEAHAVAKEVIDALSKVTDAHVTVTLEIHAEAPDPGFGPDIVMAVQENSTTLRFAVAEFEEE